MSIIKLIDEYLPWVLSILGAYMAFQAGNLKKWAWAFGLVLQALWLVWILCSGKYPFLIQNGMLWFVYARNHIKWNKRESQVQSS